MKEDILLSLRREHALEGLIGNHPCFTNLVQKLKNIATKNISVLLIGETGTGKGCCAEFIHQYSDRYNYPFIPYNCGAGPESLFESQIFGHVKGAFTGAHKDRPGLVEESHSGVLFLDEINSLNRNAQVKLNQFLETGCFRRLGENRFRKSDVRIIAASIVDLRVEVLEGRFREDLYFRLAEYELPVPPLRSRKEDIILLAKYFIKKNADLSSNCQVTFTPNALKELTEYHWPGNIRELENFIKRCIVDASSSIVDSVHLPKSDESSSVVESESLQILPWKEAKRRVVSAFERSYIRGLLKQYHGIVAQCARHAGIRPPDFWKLMCKYNLKAKSFRSMD